MDSVALPQMLLYLTRCSLKDLQVFLSHSLRLYSSLSPWAAIAQPSFLVSLMNYYCYNYLLHHTLNHYHARVLHGKTCLMVKMTCVQASARFAITLILHLFLKDAEEFNSIVEQLNEQVAHAADERLQSELHTLVTLMMEEKRKEKSQEPVSSTLQENSQETSQNGPALPAVAPSTVPTPSFTSVLPKALSAVLHPSLPPSLNYEPQPSKHPPNLEQLQSELRELRDQFEVMKSQHNKEMRLLMNELDEEKRVRLTLQMEIQRMKKHMSK